MIAVREGVVQLGAVNKVVEDLSYVVLLRKKFSYIESIPGVLLPHPSSSAYPFKIDGYHAPAEAWHHYQIQNPLAAALPLDHHHHQYYDHFNQPSSAMKITPSMSSLEALLSKLPSVVPPPPSGDYGESQPPLMSPFVSAAHQRPMEFIQAEKVAKEDTDEDYCRRPHDRDVGECSSSMSGYQHHFHHHQNWFTMMQRDTKP